MVKTTPWGRMLRLEVDASAAAVVKYWSKVRSRYNRVMYAYDHYNQSLRRSNEALEECISILERPRVQNRRPELPFAATT
jgi:hypothetical protein